MKRLIVSAFVLLLVACSAEPTGIRPGAAAMAKAPSSGASTISMTGDIGPLTTPAGEAVTAAVNARAPFKNLELSGVVITLNAPSGDPAVCRQAGSTRTYDIAGFGGNEGAWTGVLTIWQGSLSGASNFRFNGSRTVNGIQEVVQFTSNDNDAVQAMNGGTTTLTFNSAPLGFGSQSTHYDVDGNGLPILRCVRVTVTSISS